MMTAQDFEPTDLSLFRRLHVSDWRPNVLILCTEALLETITQQLIRSLQSSRQDPPHLCACPGPLDLPHSRCTLVLSDVGQMQMSQQLALHDWISGHHPTNVVSVTALDISARVREGLFLENLFYRLNTVRVDARSDRTALQAYLHSYSPRRPGQ